VTRVSESAQDRCAVAHARADREGASDTIGHMGQCSIAGCERPVRARGWCAAHYTRWLAHGDPNICLRPRALSVKGEVCHEEGCAEPVCAKSLCRRHYNAAHHKADRGSCSVEGCDLTIHRGTLCLRHYQRQRAHGDPLGGDPPRRRRGTGLPKRFYEKRRATFLTGATTSTAEYGQIVLWDPCAYCGAVAAQLDHIVAFSDGGEHDWTNLTGACAPCNQRKNTRPLLLFLARAHEGR
jgi:5-methylcytosine-specific restriction endonuclease McrA